MKIAVWHNLPSGGGKRALYQHVKGLIERGHKVEAWCPSSADQTYLPLGEFITEHILPFDWTPEEENRRLVRYVAPYRNMVGKTQAMDRHCRECAKEINQGGFDLLFANACMFFRATSIGRHVESPTVLYLQEPYRWLYEAMPRLPWLALDSHNGHSSRLSRLQDFAQDWSRIQALRVQAREEWLNAKAFDAILANSYFSRESILRAYGLNAHVCYLGVDTTQFVDRHQPRERLLVGLGAFVFEKNIEFVLQAVARLPEPRPPLVWIGNVADQRLLDELEQYALSVNVCFEPRLRVDDTELVDVLNRAAMLVYAPRLEPFGYAPLEAGACGMPVVAVAEGGVRETVVDGVNGVLVEPDAQAMAAGIQRLLDDPGLARQLGENGRELMQERWSLAACIDRLEARFGQAVEAARTRLR